MPDALTVKQFQERLDRISREFPGDMDEGLMLCVPEVYEGIGTNFDRQATASGVAWPARKDKDPDLDHPLLHLTGALEEAATGVNANLKPRIEDNELIMGVAVGEPGTSLGGARVHQEGYPEKNIAQREYLGFTPEAVDRCVDILADVAVENIVEVLR
jgi:hypothetical protein